MDVVTLAVAKKYTDDSLDGVGALKGVPCQIQSVTDITGGKRVTFLWVDNEETEHTSTMDVMNGADGQNGADGKDGKDGKDGADGAQGAGVPLGGSKDQILAKKSSTDNDTDWVDPVDDLGLVNEDEIFDSSAIINHNVLKVTDGSGSKNGVEWSKSDGVITLNGTTTGTVDFNLGDSSDDGVLPNGTYKLCAEIISGSVTGDVRYTNNVSYEALNYTTPKSITLSGGNRSKLNLLSGVVCNNLKIHVWANEGSTSYPYQKYGETSALVLKSSIEITRLDEHLENADIHVTSAEKAKIDSLPDVSQADFSEEIFGTASDALSDVDGKSLMLCVMTDNHVCPTAYTQNGQQIGGQSLRQYNTQLQHVKDLRLPFDALVHLGDFVNTQWWWSAVDNEEVTDEAYQRLTAQYANSLRESGIQNIFTVGGNHDGGLHVVSGSHANSYEYSDYNAIYRTVSKMTDIGADVVRTDNNPYYYVDMERYGLRLIFLCTNCDSNSSDLKGFGYQQALWLKNTLTSAPSGYNVLLFGHISFSMFKTALKTYANSEYDNVVGILTAFQNATTYTATSSPSLSVDFTGNTRKILAYLCGHYHGDRIILPSDEHSELPFAEVITASGGYVTDGVITSGDFYDASDAPSRTVNTVSEDLFDVMVFSPIAKKLSFRRFGAGIDREVDLDGIL